MSGHNMRNFSVYNRALTSQSPICRVIMFNRIGVYDLVKESQSPICRVIIDSECSYAITNLGSQSPICRVIILPIPASYYKDK